MRHGLKSLRVVVAMLVVAAFVFLGFSEMLSPAQAGKPGAFSATISPRSFTTAFGCKPHGCSPFVQFTCSASGGTPPYTYYWNWGDNSPGGGPLTGQTGPVVETHTYPYMVARYTVSFTAVDSRGLSASATATAIVKSAR